MSYKNLPEVTDFSPIPFPLSRSYFQPNHNTPHLQPPQRECPSPSPIYDYHKIVTNIAANINF